MIYLVSVTLLWAFSFSLIGVYLRDVDPWFSVLCRAALAMIVFLPFLNWSVIRSSNGYKLMAIGAIQLGLMYGFYYHSFLFLTVPEVLMFTIMTPVYITLLNDILDKKFHKRFLIAAVVAVLGALTIRFGSISNDFVVGLLLVQGANLCFATGQVAYKRLITNANNDIPQHNMFGLFYIGAFVLATISYVSFGDTSRLPTTSTQWAVLIYLGTIASGMGYFAWNKGATIVNVGTLAVMNNLLIPAGIIVNVTIWNRDADLLQLSLGGAIILLSLALCQPNLVSRFQSFIKKA